MDSSFAFQSFVDGQHGWQDFIVDLDQTLGHQGGSFGFGGDDRHFVTGIPHLAVEDQAVIRGRLGIGLAGQGEPGLGHIFPSQDQFDARHFFGLAGVDAADARMGMG